MTRTIRRLLPLAALAAGLAALGLGAAPPAAAHEGEAVIAVETVEPTDLSVRYVVRVTWSNDGHPATDAVVTATAVAPDGTQTTPVTMTPIDADGRYEGTVEHPAPGAWTVRFTVVEPPGTLDHPVELAAPAPTTTAAMSEPWASKIARTPSTSLYAARSVSFTAASLTPGLLGTPRVVAPDPAWASSASTWPW